jgi:tRNA(Ile)-lysidine synthase
MTRAVSSAPTPAPSPAPADRVFLETIKNNRLIEKGDRVLVGFSGGADSACLLDLFITYAKQLKITVAACHVNHLLRGKDSDRDEMFAHDFCSERNVEFVSCRVDVKKYSKKNGLSLETAARECRYDAFLAAAGETGANKIATAHHRDDLAETLLYRIFKGTGISGLASIPVRRDNIIRPLLYLSKKQIVDRVEKRKLPFVKDLSNDDESFDRNYIRKTVVPAIEKRFPGFSGKAAELAALAADEEKFWEKRTAELDRYVKEENGGFILDKKVFRDGVPAALIRRKVRGILRQVGGNAYIGSDLIERVLGFRNDVRGNKTVFRAGGLRVLSSYNNLCFLKEPKKFHKETKHVKLKEPVTVTFGNYGLTFSGVGEYKPVNDKDRMIFEASGAGSVTVRRRKDGDRIRIGGSKTKKIQDLLVDGKVPMIDRENTIVIEGPGGKVIALYVPGTGFRVSEEFYVMEGRRVKLIEVRVRPCERS